MSRVENCFAAHQIIFFTAWRRIRSKFYSLCEAFLVAWQKLSRNLWTSFENITHKLPNQTPRMLKKKQDEGAVNLCWQWSIHDRKQLIKENELFASPFVADLIAPSFANDTHRKVFRLSSRKHDSFSHQLWEMLAIWITNGSIFRRAIWVQKRKIALNIAEAYCDDK